MIPRGLLLTTDRLSRRPSLDRVNCCALPLAGLAIIPQIACMMRPTVSGRGEQGRTSDSRQLQQNRDAARKWDLQARGTAEGGSRYRGGGVSSVEDPVGDAPPLRIAQRLRRRTMATALLKLGRNAWILAYDPSLLPITFNVRAKQP